jgi:hypothetical protein
MARTPPKTRKPGYTDAGVSTPDTAPEQAKSFDYLDAVRKTKQTQRDKARLFIKKNPTTSI